MSFSNSCARLCLANTDGSLWSVSFASCEQIKADSQWTSFILYCLNRKIKAPEIWDNLFYNRRIPRSMKMWTSVQLKSVHPHGAVMTFIKTGRSRSSGWTCELGSTLVSVSSKAFAIILEEAGFPRRQLFIKLVWKRGSGGCVLMNYSGQ